MQPQSDPSSPGAPPRKISGSQVRSDFNAVRSVIHYARAARAVGLWKSERILIERHFPDRTARLLEAGCGTGRASIALWELGYRSLTAFDFAEEALGQAREFAAERGAAGLRFVLADATKLPAPPDALPGGPFGDSPFGGVLFLFNGLMQIPGRERRRAALANLRSLCAPGAPFLFTTHDRNHSEMERALWRLEAVRWETGAQDPRLREFGDRYFEDEAGHTFMHLPDRAEVLEDLAATGWTHAFDALRSSIAAESAAVRDFSDECRFWLARAPDA